MIYAVFIFDDSGVLIHSYEISGGPFKVDASLTSNFLAALLNFGQEILEIPQRIDMKNYSVTFLKGGKGKGYWLAIVTDVNDTYSATFKALIKIYESVKDELERFDEVGMVFQDEKFEKQMEEILSHHAKSMQRTLREYRSGGVKTLIFSLLVATLIDFLVIRLIFQVASLTTLLNFSLAMLVIAFATGMASGYAAGVPNESLFGTWIGSILASLIIILMTLSQPVSITDLLGLFIFQGISMGGFNSTVAYLVATIYDRNYLK
ncbi:MAG: hypothetical protein ACP6IP_01020 [Candidatus Njordarchaeia archaeon]